MAFLVIDEETESRHDLSGDKTTIGRHPENTIQLGAGTVSGKHAEIVQNDGTFTLRDVGSRNGTAVNGEPVTSNVVLRDSDQIAFGDTLAKFVNVEQSENEPVNPTIEQATDSVGAKGSHRFQHDSHAEMPKPNLNVEITSSSMETISGAVDSSSRFGLMQAKPEAKLRAVLEISTSLAGSVDLDVMLPKILDTLFAIFRIADRGCILIKDPITESLVPRVIRHRRENQDESVRISRTVLDMVMNEKKGIRSADAAMDDVFSSSESIADMRIRSMMCVPMLALNGEPIGAISIDSLNPLGQFTDEDLDLLYAIAGQAALSYESARLMASFMEKQKQDTEMRIAANVQLALLPEELPTVEGYEFFASYDAAQAVGGDYYDVFELSGDDVCVSFGDVAGKGVPGALIMSRMHSCVQNTMAHVTDLEEAILAINDHMCSTSIEGRFVTYVLSIVDTKNHVVSLSNAGHMSPMIRRADGTIEQFDDDLVGPPIGVVEEYPYEVESRTLDPGDTVLIVTDGVDEAMNHEGELYTTERIINFLKQDFNDAKDLGERLLADVRKHADGRPQNDDITIFAFGRT